MENRPAPTATRCGAPIRGMTAKDLCAAGRKLYGPRGWQRRMAEALHTDPRTIRRWVAGDVPVPGPAEAAIQCFLERGEKTP